MRRTIMLALLAGVVGSVPAPTLAEEGAAETDEGEPGDWTLTLHAVEEYRFRYATAPQTTDNGPQHWNSPGDAPEAEQDHDLRLFLGGDVRDREDKFTIDYALGLWWDADGVHEDESSSFASMRDDGLVDAADPPYLWIDVYSLNGDYHSDGLLALARVGRQQTEHGRPATFDGGAVRLAPLGPTLELFAFGGRTVHFFEVQNGYFEDWLASGGVAIRPLEELRIELDYRFLMEDTLLVEDIVDHSYGLNAWYRFDRWLYLNASVRGLNDAVSHAGGAAALLAEELELGLDLSAEAQLITLDEVTEREDPIFAALGESLPYVRFRADVYKAFTTDLGVYTAHLGYEGRQLTEDDPAEFNRNWGRAYLWLEARDIVTHGPFVTALGEYNLTHDGGDVLDDGFFTAGGSAGWDEEPLHVEAGSFYQRFKYVYYADLQEVADVQTTFAELGWRFLPWLKMNLRYELEQFDRYTHTALVTLSESF